MSDPDLETVEDLSAGGVVYRIVSGTPEFLVGEQTDWRTGERNVRLPKGHLDPGESLEQAAIREVAEETGRHARIEEKLGEHAYTYDDPGRGQRVQKRVVFYLMADEGDHDECRDDEMHTLHWLNIEAALARLTFDNERAMVRLAQEHLVTAGIGGDRGVRMGDEEGGTP